MKPASEQLGLAKRILDDPHPAVVVRGQACSGKTAAMLGIYERLADAGGPGRCVLLCPNFPAVQAVKKLLLARSPVGVIVQPRVMTFSALAGVIVAAAGVKVRPISPFQRRIILRKIIDELNQANKLGVLSRVADTPGLAVSLDRTIAELKRAAIEPEKLAKVVGKTPSRALDVLRVYRRYQQLLLAENACDVEGQMWLARECLASDNNHSDSIGLEDIAVVAADGFTDFTPTQLDILSLLSKRMRRVVMTLTFGRDGRARMWHWTGRTLNRIRRAFGERLAEIETCPRGGQKQESLAQKLCRSGQKQETLAQKLCRSVFDLDAPRSDWPDGLHIIAAGSADAEVASVARKVKKLLARGARAGSILVTARGMEIYRPAIERIFAGHDIPIAPAPLPLSKEPIVRFLFDAMEISPKFEFHSVLRVVKNSYFRPQSLGDFDDSDAATAEMLIREGNVFEGRGAYSSAAERLGRLAAQPDESDDEADDAIRLGPLASSPEKLARAAAMLERLFEIVSEASSQAAGCDGIARLVEAFSLYEAAVSHDDDALIARDLRALGSLHEALEEAKSAGASTKRLGEAMEAVACPAEKTESLVDVLGVLDARMLRYDHVFLLGVSEHAFPQRNRGGGLITESDRSAFSKRGLAMDLTGDLTAREMLLFYQAVGRADTSLTVSFQDRSAGNAAGAPSGFLLSLIEPFGGLEGARGAGAFRRIAPGELIPADAEIASPADAINAAAASLFHPDADPRVSARAWAVENSPETLERAARGIWSQYRRWRYDRCDSFDGRIGDDDLRKELVGLFGPAAVFSASMLSAFGRCPWMFFAKYVLQLEPLASPQRRLEPVSLGIFVHDVLCRTMLHLRDESDGPSVRLPEIPPDRIEAAMDESLAEAARKVERSRPPYPALWRIQKAQVRDQLLAYLLDQRQTDGMNVESLHFELSFGGAGRNEDTDRTASATQPVTVRTDSAGDVLLRGKIDRIDRIACGRVSGLLAVDYKTGYVSPKKDILAGLDLQLPVYIEAMAELFDENVVGGAFHRTPNCKVTTLAAIKLYRGSYRPDDKFADNREKTRELIGRCVSDMRSGRFDVLPGDKCPSYCPYRMICRYSPPRAERKVPADSQELSP